MQTLSSHLSNITQNIYKERGFYQTKIINDWKFIVGEDFFSKTIPGRIIFKKYEEKFLGKLQIYVKDNNVAIELQYMTNYIIEKISTYFGYKAINQISLVVKSEYFTKSNLNKHSSRLSDFSKNDENRLNNKIKDIKDDILRDSLFNLGKLIILNSKVNNGEN